MNGRTIQKTSVEGVHNYNRDKAYSMFAGGKEIYEKHQYGDDNKGFDCYRFSDGTSLQLGTTF
ncbi:hypothetical protein NE644_22620, partial [Blautia wexlerae]|uniref:hypothetical protein n=1 Tax=Blautia wexlerae TaxID=418240 RepID=UPI00210DD974